MPEKPRKLRVFLCHTSADKPMVLELYQRLMAEDWIDPWLDSEKILPGQHWTSVIRHSLADADSVIILISNSSINREGFVQREMNYAWDLSLEKPRSVIYLIPLRLEDCEVPFDLRERQWADYFGGKKDETYRALLRSLKLRHEQKLVTEAEEYARLEKQKRDRELAEKARLEAEELERKKSEKEEIERKSAEKAAREKAEKDAAEKVRVEAEKQARRKAAKEKAEHEAAVKTARERAEKESAEKARLESEELARQKDAKENAEREAAAEKARRDALEKIRRERAERWSALQLTLKRNLAAFFATLKSGFGKPNREASTGKNGWLNAKYIFLLLTVVLAITSAIVAKFYGFSVNKGASIYVTYNESGKRSIFQLVGGVIQNTNLAVNDDSWSPAADTRGNLYFVSDRKNGKIEIFALKSSGEVVPVTDSKGKADNWSPAPDSLGNLYFVSNRENNGMAEIFVLLSSGETKQVTDLHGEASNWSPAPDHLGNLYFVSNRDNGKAEIYVLLSSGETKQVTDSKGIVENWSPAPDHFGNLYFTSNRDKKAEVYVLLANGKTKQVTDSNGEADNWSPKPDSLGNLYFTSNRYDKQKVFTIGEDGQIFPVRVVDGVQSWTGTLSEQYAGKQ